MRRRDRRQQRLGIGMRRRAEQAVGIRDLDDAAEIHHRDAVRNVPDHRKIVRNEQVGEIQLPLQILEQVDDLRLHRDVESRDGLIADDEAGPQGKRARDADPLPLPAREFMRIALRGRTRQADKIQHLEHRFRTRCAIADRVNHIRLRDDRIADRHARIERADTDPGR